MQRIGLALCLLLLPVGAVADADIDEVFTYTPVMHASFVLQSGSTTIYIDPVGAIADYDAFPAPDLILITHIHHDHLDPQLIGALRQVKTQVIGPPTVIEQLGYGTALHNGEITGYAGLAIVAVPAYNTTAERLDFHPQGRDNGYLISKDGVQLYISGDTEDIPEMRALSDIDIAFVCMNLPFTMNVEQAASAVNDFKPKRVIPYHFRGKENMSDLGVFEKLVTSSEVIRLEWY